MKPTFLVLIFFLSANFIFAQEESFDDFLESDDDFGLDFEVSEDPWRCIFQRCWLLFCGTVFGAGFPEPGYVD